VPSPHFFGGEIGIKNRSDVFFGDSNAGVRYLQFNILPGRKPIFGVHRGSVNNDIVEADLHHTAVIFHGLGRVGQQIHQNLVDLYRIGHNQGLACNVLPDRDACGDGGSYQFQHYHAGLTSTKRLSSTRVMAMAAGLV
jgi:hypothetical protein